MAYQYSYTLQENAAFNIPVYPSTNVGGFTLNNIQSTITDETSVYATPLYSWYVASTAISQPVSVSLNGVGNVSVCTLSTRYFGPSGSPYYSNSAPPLTQWVDNPTTTYPTQYPGSNSCSNTFVGPSFVSAIYYQNQASQTVSSVQNVWSFNIQPFQAQDSSGGEYISYPISTAYGANNTPGNAFLSTYPTITTGLSEPKYWYKVDLLNGPLGQTLPVPYVDGLGNVVTANVRTIFATPYSPSYYNQNTYNSQNPLIPLSGYFVAFYKPPPELPLLTYPVIYDAANLQNQSYFNTADSDARSISALAFLNKALGTSYTTLDLLFAGEDWLEEILLNEQDGGGVATGVDLGSDFGSGWYVMGLVPYNLYLANKTSTNPWVPSIADFNITDNINDYLFCSGNLTIGSMLNPAGTGNLFWRILEN